MNIPELLQRKGFVGRVLNITSFYCSSFMQIHEVGGLFPDVALKPVRSIHSLHPL